MLDHIDIVKLSGDPAHNLHYATLFEGELLLGFYTKEAADKFEQTMPKNSYRRMTDHKISIRL